MIKIFHKVRRLLGPKKQKTENGSEELAARQNITRLIRNAAQLALIKQLCAERTRNKTLRVMIHGVADGAEAISLLLILDPMRAPYQLSIQGFDLAAEYIGYAQTFTYTQEQLAPERYQPYFANYLQNKGEAGWHLKEEWQSQLSYKQQNVLDLIADDNNDQYDIVMFQNALISMTPPDIHTALSNLNQQVKSGGILVVGGGPLDIVPTWLIANQYTPILTGVAHIHESWTTQRKFYENPKRPYWALEPFDASHPQGASRYCTIFQKPSTT